jgi:hypothetical protein
MISADPNVISALESAGLLGWQKRELREREARKISLCASVANLL